MSILTGPEIARQIRRGAISIDPYDPKRLNSNSYNIRLGDRLATYVPGTLSTREKPKILEEIPIPPEGFVMKRGDGYLGFTVEKTRCEGFVPVIDGRSSTGRLFLIVHCTAGFGDDGFDGQWTLEMVSLAADLRVFPGDEILQIRFEPTMGQRKPYRGRYQGQSGPTASKTPQPNE